MKVASCIICLLLSHISFGSCILVVKENRVSISALDKALILQVLHNNALLPSLPSLQNQELSYIDAKKLIENSETNFFSYVNGRALHIDLSGQFLDTENYNHRNGINTAETAICNVFNESIHQLDEL